MPRSFSEVFSNPAGTLSQDRSRSYSCVSKLHAGTYTERSVRLHVPELNAVRARDARQKVHLFTHERSDFRRREVLLAPAQSVAIGVPRMRADGQPGRSSRNHELMHGV